MGQGQLWPTCALLAFLPPRQTLAALPVPQTRSTWRWAVYPPHLIPQALLLPVSTHACALEALDTPQVQRTSDRDLKALLDHLSPNHLGQGGLPSCLSIWVQTPSHGPGGPQSSFLDPCGLHLPGDLRCDRRVGCAREYHGGAESWCGESRTDWEQRVCTVSRAPLPMGCNPRSLSRPGLPTGIPAPPPMWILRQLGCRPCTRTWGQDAASSTEPAAGLAL